MNNINSRNSSNTNMERFVTKNKYNSDLSNIICSVFVALFPIVPYYFNIGISILSLLCIGFIFVALFLTNIKIPIKGIYLYAILFISVMWKGVIGIAHGDFVFFLMNVGIYYLACFFLSQNLSTLNSIEKAIDILINVSLVISFLGGVEAVTGKNVFLNFNNTNTVIYNAQRLGLNRIFSSQSHPISYCLYCMMIMCLIVYKLNSSININRKRKLFLKITYCLLFLNALLTLSRSTIIIMIFSQLLLSMALGYRRLLKIIGVSIGVISIALVISYFAFPNLFSKLSNILFMILAVFNSDYTSRISGMFGNDNLYATGDRLKLYFWVLNDIKGHFWFGMGPSTKFYHLYHASDEMYSWTDYKTSIEVHHLDILFHYGLIALLFEIIATVSIIYDSFHVGKKFQNNNRLSLGVTLSIISICYMISWFATSYMTEYRTFLTILALYLAYRNLCIRNGSYQ